MELRNKAFFSWLPWVISALVSALFALLLRNELTHQERDWQKHLRMQQAGAESALSVSQAHLLQQASGYAQLLARDKEIIALVRRAAEVYARDSHNDNADKTSSLRLQLQHTLAPYWEQAGALGVRELTIHFATPGRVFLRMNDISRFGDSATEYSPLLMTVLKKKVLVSGMEVGHYGANYRAFAPITASDDAGELVAALEIGVGLVARTDATTTDKGTAVLISAAVTNHFLWDSVRREVIGAANSRQNPWYVESASHMRAKTWQQSGMFDGVSLAARAPKTIQEQGKTYMLSFMPLEGFALPNTLAVAPQILLLTWNDVSSAKKAFSADKKLIINRYIVGWLFAMAALWILFRFNRRYIVQLLREHSKQLQKERDLSEQARHRLTLALVSSESGFWEWNISTNRVTFSKEWRELCGLPVIESMTDDGSADVEEWLMRVHPSDKRASYSEMIRHVKGETPMFENEYRLRVADGSYKWIFTRGKVVEWAPSGRATLMLGVYTDITGRKENEITVVRQQAALRALNEIASLPSVDAEAQLCSALEIGGRYLGLPHGALSEVHGNHYQLKIELGKQRDHKEIAPISNYFCEFALSRKDIFDCDNISSSEYTNCYAYQYHKVESYIGVPVWVHGRIYGVLSFDSERSRYQAYDDLDRNFMNLFARWVGVTLERWQYQSEQNALIKRFEKLCNQLPGFLYQYQLSADGTSSFPFASSGISEIYGVTAQDVASDATAIFSVIHQQDIGWVSESISASAATLKDWNATYRVIHPLRGEIWVHGEARPERLAKGATLWNGYMQDVTDEKLAALKLQDINALREAIFNAASVAIISTDPSGLIKTFNQGAEDLLGYTPAEVIDIKTPSIFHVPEEVEARASALTKEFGLPVLPGFDVFIVKSREGSDDENEWTYVRKDGTRVPVILSVTTLRSADGDITGYLGLARDISEIKRIDRMKSEFISTVSHELRTPLTAISGALGIIVNGAAGDVPDTAIKMLNIAHKNSLRLIHLVNDLLDMEKLAAGKMNFDMKLHPLEAIVTQSLEDNAAYAAQYRVKVQLDNRIRPDVRVNVDSQRLLQVLANFISNAAKFSPPDEIVELRIEYVFKTVRVSVVDKGPGIPEEFRSRIFQKFSQADSSDTRQKGGTGLGLAICKEIIERMGGKVGFMSDGVKGSQFYFDLPSEEYVMTPAPRTPTGERLLVIESNTEAAELFATMLRAQNYRVDVAYSGQSALERLALYTYHLLTMDLELSDMNGMELIKQLRSDAATKNIPIIVLSTSLDAAPMAHRNSPTFAEVQWLQKPQTAAAIIEAVKKVIANQGRNDESSVAPK